MAVEPELQVDQLSVVELVSPKLKDEAVLGPSFGLMATSEWEKFQGAVAAELSWDEGSAAGAAFMNL